MTLQSKQGNNNNFNSKKENSKAKIVNAAHECEVYITAARSISAKICTVVPTDTLHNNSSVHLV